MSVRSSIPTAGVMAQRPAEESLSVIDRHSSVDGSLNTTQDLRIEGRIDGTLRCDGVLHVAPGAEIDADIDAAAIIVEGSLSGVVQCRGRLEVRSTGVVRADIDTARLVIHEGGRVEGRVTMRRVEQERTAESGPIEDVASTSDPAATINPPNAPFLRGFPGPRPVSTNGDDDLPGSRTEEDEPEA